MCAKAKLVQSTYVSSVIEDLPQRNGVIDVSFVSVFHLTIHLSVLSRTANVC